MFLIIICNPENMNNATTLLLTLLCMKMNLKCMNLSSTNAIYGEEEDVDIKYIYF